MSPLTVEGEGNEDPGNIASLNTPSTSSHLRVQHITNITNLKALLAPAGAYRAFGLNMNPLSRKSRRMVLLDTGAGLKEKEFNTLMNMNPTGDVINFLLSGKPVEGLRIHNEVALRQCLQRIM